MRGQPVFTCDAGDTLHVPLLVTLIHQPIYALNKIHSESVIKLLHVSTQEYHHQGIIKNKGVTRPAASLGVVSPFLK